MYDAAGVGDQAVVNQNMWDLFSCVDESQVIAYSLMPQSGCCKGSRPCPSVTISFPFIFIGVGGSAEA
jgi:hypothetical protein